MNADQILSEIREANLSYLMLAQSLIRSDREQALYRLGISEESAALIGLLTPAQMMKITAGNTLLCRFRMDDDMVWGLLTNHGKSAASWNMNEGSPSRSTVPRVGASRPATRLSRVDLPQPEAPMRHTNSPGRAMREMSSSAVIVPDPAGKTFVTLRSSTVVRASTAAVKSKPLHFVPAEGLEDLVQRPEVVEALQVPGVLQEVQGLRISRGLLE